MRIIRRTAFWNRIIASVCLSILGTAGAHADASTMRIASPALSLEWAKSDDGWHLREITAGGKPIERAQGFTNVLFSEKTPPSGEVLKDGAGENSTFYFSDAEQLSETSIRFSHSLAVADVESIWEIDAEFPTDIKVTMKLIAKSAGFYSIASPTLAALSRDDLEWGMIPGNWYGREMENDMNLSTRYSMGIPSLPHLANERNSGTLAPMISLKSGVTLAVIPEPGTSADPWKDDAYNRRKMRVGMSLLNRHKQLMPVLYSPILGEEGSELKSGETTGFQFRYSIQAADWFTVFNHAVNNIYKLPSILDIQRNRFSLTDRVDRMLHFLDDDERAHWNTWKVHGYEVGATGNKNADSGTMCMIARNADDRAMQRRMETMRNFKLAQQQTWPGPFQGAALGEYGDEEGFRSEVGNWIEPLFTTYYTMIDMGNMLLFDPADAELKERLRMGADKLLDWQHDDGSWDVAYDVFSQELTFPDLIDYRPTWYGLLIAHRILGDQKYLDAAKKAADWQMIHGVNQGRFLGVCGDTRNVWDFATAQTSQAYMDLYDITKDARYREAGIESARIYTTSIFTHPIANDAIKKVNDKEFKDWEISQVGLGVEHIRGTAAGRGPILLSSYAGLFVRMFEETQEPVFLTMARAAARGRQAFVGEQTGVSVYYWDSLPHVARDQDKFPWHAFWQIGWITDYLLAEAHLRSEGEITFPAGFMTPKVGPHRTFGFAPGTIFGHKADLVFRQGMLECDNADIEIITALSEDKKTLFALAIHQSPNEGTGTLKIDFSKLAADAKWTSEEVLLGDAPVIDRATNSLGLTIPAWGMQVIAIEIAENP
ncbi:MAG: glycerophosphoryl diester phosphodiesterase [Luteolibacter sp.]